MVTPSNGLAGPGIDLWKKMRREETIGRCRRASVRTDGGRRCFLHEPRYMEARTYMRPTAPHARRPLHATPALLAAFLASCGSTPEQQPPLEPPALLAEVVHVAGSPLSGPVSMSVLPASAREGLHVEARILSLETLPRDELDPLGEHTRLVASSGGAFPLLPVSRLARGARAGKLDDAETYLHRVESGRLGRSAPIASLSGALFPGTTVVFRLRAPDYMRLLGRSPESLELQVHLPAAQGPANEREGPSRPEVAIAIQGLLPPRNEDMPPAAEKEEPKETETEKKKEKAKAEDVPPSPEAEAPPVDPLPGSHAREIVIVDGCEYSSVCRLAVFLPSPFAPSLGGGRALAAIIDVRPPSEGGSDPDLRHDEAFAKCIADLSGSPAEAAPGHAEEFDLHDIGALSALRVPASRRQALLFIAEKGGARIAADTAISASDKVLEKIAAPLIATRTARLDRAGLAWLLEKSTLEVLLDLHARNVLPPELAAVLVRQAGEAGLQPSSLEEVFKSSRGFQDLEERLVTENYIFLEDSSPASRIRALAWLEARKKAPEGYDPLAAPRERRVALEKALEKLESERVTEGKEAHE